MAKRCRKIPFRDEIAAKLALATMATHWPGRKEREPPRSVYQCPGCHKWHHTSKPQRKGKNPS